MDGAVGESSAVHHIFMTLHFYKEKVHIEVYPTPFFFDSESEES